METQQQHEAREQNRREDFRIRALAQEIDSQATLLGSLFEEWQRRKTAQKARSEAAGLPEASTYALDDAAQRIFYLLRHVPNVPSADERARDKTLPDMEAEAHQARTAAIEAARATA